MSGFRFRLAIASCATVLALAASQATALDATSAFEPAVTLHWSFGGAPKAKSGVDLGLRLNYAQAPFHAFGATRLPAFAEWTFNSSGADALMLNGVPLHTGNLYASEAEVQAAPAADGSGPGVRVGLILLGAGGATALIVSALGNAAHENNPAVADNQSGFGCNSNPVASGCVAGGGG